MSRYAKALVASIPVLVALLNILADKMGGGDVTADDVGGLIVATLALLGVYAVPNRPPAGQLADPGISEQRR